MGAQTCKKLPNEMAGSASSGRIFSVKWTLLRLPSVKIFLTTKIKYSKTFPVCRFCQKSKKSTHFSEFQLFFFDRLFAQKLKNPKNVFFQKKKTPKKGFLKKKKKKKKK